MARILTGITSNNTPHLGNILGAVLPAIELSKQSDNESLFFIADLHSLISQKNAQLRIDSVNSVAATWLAFDFDTEKNMLYRQSRIPEVCELTWYLNCFTPYPMLANAHSFKDKSDRLKEVNSGLFTYPVLMAADIILYDAEFVPVGKDQIQHIEMARDIVAKINHEYDKEIFVLPEGKIDSNVMLVPGIDGQKMSKSYNNFINIFLPEKELLKVVKTIETDSTPLEEPKDYETCNVFNIFKLIASASQIEEMKSNYTNGGYGYGHAKTALYELLLVKFEKARKTYNALMANPELIEKQLIIGEAKARKIAQEKLEVVRGVLGF
jgi:tryptophanyl-tRNA synthetase